MKDFVPKTQVEKMLNEFGFRTEKPMRIEDAAEFLTVTKKAVYAMIASGKIPCHKLGSTPYCYKSEINEQLKSL